MKAREADSVGLYLRPFLYLRAHHIHHQPPATMPISSNNREFYNDIVAKIIEYIKQYKYLDVVEADLFVGISSRKDDHAVDVLVDGVKYIDDDSFGIDYSEPVRSRREQFASDGISEVEAEPDRMPDRTGSIVIRPYSDTTNWFATPRDLVELMNVVKYTVKAIKELHDEEPEPDTEDLTRPTWLLPYSEMIETERRARWIEKFHVIYIRKIIDHLKVYKTFDLSGLDLVVYMLDRNMCEFISDARFCNIETESYLVRANRISYRDDSTFLFEGGSHSAVVDIDDRQGVRLMLLDIMRLRWAVEYIVRLTKGEPPRTIDEEAYETDCLLERDGFRREALNELVGIGMRVERRHKARGPQPAENTCERSER